jgi:molecular chaperone HscB
VECWSCKADTQGKPLCPACGHVAPRPPTATYYDVFELSPRYDLDEGALEAKFRELSLKLHPDKYAQADPRERRLSLEQSSALNKAYKVLRDPLKRAFYLLSLHGIDLEDEEGDHTVQMPHEFLLSMLEQRESLQHAKERGELGQVQKMGQQMEARQTQALGEAAMALRALETDGADEQAKQRAAEVLGRVRYFSRFLEEVSAIEEEALA